MYELKGFGTPGSQIIFSDCFRLHQKVINFYNSLSNIYLKLLSFKVVSKLQLRILMVKQSYKVILNQNKCFIELK